MIKLNKEWKISTNATYKKNQCIHTNFTKWITKKNYFADNSCDYYGDYSDCRLKIASFNRISIETII